MAGRTVATGRRRAARVAAAVTQVAARGVLLTVTALATMTLLPLAFGWRSEVILTGSMQPRLRPGDVVVAEPVTAAVVQPGQILVVADPAFPGRRLVHRFLFRNPDGTLTLKGDANAEPDSTPLPPSGVRARPRLLVPFIGRPLVWLRFGRADLTAGALAGFVALQFLAWRRLSPAGPRPDGVTA